MAIKKIGHLGIYAQNFEKMREFYTKVVRLHVADETEDVCFMTADPKREHHEFVLFRAKNGEKTCVQQISFSCERLEDVVDYFNRFRAADVRFNAVTSHGNAVGLYFYDPEDNRVEVYWTTPFEARQPYGVAVDLTRPIDEIMRSIEADVAIYKDTGHRDPESYVRQKAQFDAMGIRT